MAPLSPPASDRARKKGPSVISDACKAMQCGDIAGNSRALTSWVSMLRRCIDPTLAAWGSYGGRGITVCERWSSFEHFLSDMGPRPVNRSLDRINNAGNYEPSNCRWATAQQQARNTRRNVKLGNGMFATDAAAATGLTESTISRRIKKGLKQSEILDSRPRRATKLDRDEVKAIRALIASGLLDGSIAPQFSVSRMTISSIRRGVTWRQ